MVATSAVVINPMIARDDSMMSGPAHVILPSAMRFWISTNELGNVVTGVLIVPPPPEVLLANGFELSRPARAMAYLGKNPYPHHLY
jgi:hypothetical protein